MRACPIWAIAAVWALTVAPCAARSDPPDFIAAKQMPSGGAVLLMMNIETRAFYGAALVEPARVDILVRRGKSEKVKDWPATFHSPRRACGGTLVAANVLLTAAHCVKGDPHIEVGVGPNLVTGDCDVAALYVNPRVVLDQALCLLNGAVAAPAYERINTDVLSEGGTLYVIGAGCTEDNRSGPTGFLFGGDAKIKTLPAGYGTDIMTDSGADLCPGDSGNGAYHIVGGRRALAGVNSWTPGAGASLLARESYFASTTALDSRVFMEAWSVKRHADICGVSPRAVNCKP